jgi:hypothetical protein
VILSQILPIWAKSNTLYFPPLHPLTNPENFVYYTVPVVSCPVRENRTHLCAAYMGFSLNRLPHIESILPPERMIFSLDRLLLCPLWLVWTEQQRVSHEIFTNLIIHNFFVWFNLGNYHQRSRRPAYHTRRNYCSN